MFRITEQENKKIRKMYGLISESTIEDCTSNIMEFKEFKYWCAAKQVCNQYKIKKTLDDNVCSDTELIKAYNDKALYDKFKEFQGPVSK